MIYYRKDTKFIKQEGEADAMYLVDSGMFQCLKRYQGDEQDMYMRDYIPGDTFGE